MKETNRKNIFNLFGTGIIIVWLVMAGFLVKKIEYVDSPGQTGMSDHHAGVDSLERDWMEIYLNDKKIGYSMSQVSPLDQNYLIREELHLNLNVMGQASAVRTITRAVLDKDFLLESFKFQMSSGIVNYQLSGTVNGNRLILDKGSSGSGKKEVLILESPPVIGAGLSQFFRNRTLKAGDKFSFPVFDPSTMAQKVMTFNVTADEPIIINDIRYRSKRVETEMWGRSMSIWLDEDGSVLKETGFMGLTMVRSSADKAPFNIAGTDGEDFYDLTAVKVKGNIKHPERIRYLKVKLEGDVSFDNVSLAGERQKYNMGVLEISRESAISEPAYSIPYQGGNPEMEKYIRPELNIQSDNEAIVKKALEIAGNNVNPLAVSRKIMGWVYDNIDKKPLITVPSAIEVLETRTGDCNEHAVLLTALLRAAGIPARMCVGLVYSRGAFFYHAWTECFVGQWISLDATVNQMPVDATHIKILQGGLDKQVGILPLIGKLQIKIIEYR